jgi:hypothetical protein
MAIIILAALSTCAAGVAFRAYRDANAQKAAAQDQARVSLIRSVVAYAYKADAQDRREQAALLAQQAYLLDQKHKGKELGLIEDALRTIFRTAAIAEEPGSKVLVEQVCQKVKLQVALTPEEWAQFVGTTISYEPVCPELLKPHPLQLRREKMLTSAAIALSLNLRGEGDFGYPTQYVENRFEDQSDMIFDRTTGLTWQKFGSPKQLTYDQAQEYIRQLNREQFGEYADWRLPTVEELLSLIEKEKNSDGRFIDSRFDATQEWVWSVDIRQIKGENLSSTAWVVHFSFGLVDWGRLEDRSYVRAVRS